VVAYALLESEQVWHDQIVPPFMTSFLIVPLREHYGLGADLIGAPGDNNHLYGRHRSPNWDRQSRYCTDRAYGTTDARDHAGDQDWYRAVDIGITGDELHAACRRLDTAVRAGQLPEVAEWFGTFDGQTVVGWYEGHPSSSDSSHLFHMHVGFWTQYANDFRVMQRVFAVITQADPVPEEDEMKAILVRFADAADPQQIWYCDGQFRRAVPPGWVGTGDGPITNHQVHLSWLLGNLAAGDAPGDGHPGQWDATGTVFVSTGNPDVWGVDVATLGGTATVDQAAVEAAAERGAKAGINGATISTAP
jgi:hypothetical protein